MFHVKQGVGVNGGGMAEEGGGRISYKAYLWEWIRA